MTVTTLDPKTALIVIDLQKGIVAYPTAHPIAGVIQNSVNLLDAFHQRGLPVVLVNVTGGAPGRNEQPPRGAFPEGWADLIPEMNAQPSDHRVTKQTWGAFAHTGLEQHLKQAGVTHVVVIGVSTSIGVESTAREAFAAGFNVTIATDATTDTNIDAYTNSVTRIFPRLGETGTTQDILGLLPRVTG